MKKKPHLKAIIHKGKVRWVLPNGLRISFKRKVHQAVIDDRLLEIFN